MKRSLRPRWTKAEKWLFGAPLLVGVFAAAMNFGPGLVRRKMGWPRRVEVGNGGIIGPLALSKNGQVLAVASWSGKRPVGASRVELWNARTLQKLAVPVQWFVAPVLRLAPKTILPIDSLTFSPDGHRLFARGQDAVLVWDLD